MKNRIQKLIDLGCIICREYHQVYSVPEIHHLRTGVGIGQRSDKMIPLCPLHHRLSSDFSFHLARKFFEENYGTELELLEKVNDSM